MKIIQVDIELNCRKSPKWIWLKSHVLVYFLDEKLSEFVTVVFVFQESVVFCAMPTCHHTGSN